MPEVRFTYQDAWCDRKHYIDESDVTVVLSRLPIEAWNNLRAVHFNDRGRGVRLLGYANVRGRDISICALPPEVSLTRFLVPGQAPETFGAVRGGQWPEVAVRRYLLYDVLLHEIGHLQVVREKARSDRLKYAHENLAQKFADEWRLRLWSSRFDHPDPAHNPPSVRELNLSRLLKLSKSGRA
jgi:hypothetical protein